jgi:hypothetical protein
MFLIKNGSLSLARLFVLERNLKADVFLTCRSSDTAVMTLCDGDRGFSTDEAWTLVLFLRQNLKKIRLSARNSIHDSGRILSCDNDSYRQG